MRVSFYNIGCKVNLADISGIIRQFEALGHEIVEYGQPSDVVLINTCTVTSKADRDARKITRRSLKISPNAFIGVLGCYAQVSPEEIAAIEGVDAILGTNEKFAITKLITNFEKRESTEIFVADTDDIAFHTSATIDNESRTRVVLKLQDGCDYKCTFCTIPLARGASRSMPFDEISHEIDRIKKAGYFEIVLSGINLGEYKAPGGEDFADALCRINSAAKQIRSRISSIEPNLLTTEIIDIVKDSDVFCRHFHIPLQSGSPEILRKMKRRYKADDFRSLILNIKEKMPDCGIGVDVISGFPGETDEHFRQTYNLLESLPVSYLHAFTYSERENTPAYNFTDPVPGHVRKHRTNRLRRLSDKKTLEFYQSQIGSVQRIIPETYNSKTGRWCGWTDNYVKVLFEAVPDLAGCFHQVELVELAGDVVIGRLAKQAC